MHLAREGRPGIKVEDIVDIARAAGRVILDVYKEDRETWESRSKSDNTPVTKADVMADELIRTSLLMAYPDIPIISEEAEQVPFEQRKDYDYCWIVDPLDGTKEFIKRTGHFAVMIGLCFKGEPVLGVVHAPARRVPKTHYAVAGQGAFVLTGDACGEGLAGSARLSVRSFAVEDAGLTLAVSSSRPPEVFIAACTKPVTRSIGSAALKAIAVAEGTADVFPCTYNTSEWDTCAAQIIVEEAGGSVIRYESPETQGMPGVSLLLSGSAGTAVDEGEACRSELRLSYNKEDLSSPHCLFLGGCSGR